MWLYVACTRYTSALNRLNIKGNFCKKKENHNLLTSSPDVAMFEKMRSSTNFHRLRFIYIIPKHRWVYVLYRLYYCKQSEPTRRAGVTTLYSVGRGLCPCAATLHDDNKQRAPRYLPCSSPQALFSSRHRTIRTWSPFGLSHFRSSNETQLYHRKSPLE